MHPCNGLLFDNKKKSVDTTRWTKSILLNERSHTWKAAYCISPSIWHYRKDKTVGTENKQGVARGWGGIRGSAQRGTSELKGAMKLLYLDCSSDYMTICVLSCVQDSATPWTVEPIRLLYPWGFSRQEQGSGLPWPPPEDLPNPIRSPSLQMDSLLPEPPWKPKNTGVGSLSLCQVIFPTQKSKSWIS